MEKIRLVVVDDHPLFREGVVLILAAEPDIEIVGQGSSAESAIQLARTLMPDIMILDINMPGGGVYATRTINELSSSIKLVILTGSDEDEYILDTFRAGAQAYLLKGVTARELIEVLHLVQAGQSYVSPILAAGLLREMSKAKPTLPQQSENILGELSERENQILSLISEGLSNLAIAQRLFLTEKTIKHYVTNIFHKLNVQNRVQAALLAQKTQPMDTKSQTNDQKTKLARTNRG